MLSAYISSDNTSIFILVMFVIMIIIGLGVFAFLFKQLTKPKQKQVEELPDDYDGIHEKNNPTPYGMHIVMLCTVIFSFWYITFGFPLFHFDQTVQYQEEVKDHHERFNEKWKNIDDASLLAMGESVFNTQCVVCHGINGKGQKGRAANLIEFGTEKHILFVIQNGSTGLRKLTQAMPAQYENLGSTDEERKETAENIAAYVMTMSNKKPTFDHANIEAGKVAYQTNCFACHGTNGKGMGPTGNIPNFAADLTEYGNPDYIKEILKNGKKGYIGGMPAFDEIGVLSDIQYDAVSKYVATQLN